MFSFESNIPVILLINLLILLKSNVEFNTLSMINALKFGLLLLIMITKKVNTTIVIRTIVFIFTYYYMVYYWYFYY